MIRVLIITTDYSTFVSEIQKCPQLFVVGILNCIPSGRLETFAHQQDIPYKLLTQQDAALQQWIRERKPDVIAVFRMPFLLRKEIFSLPRYGSLNLHPSLLPSYRGPNPWFWVYFYKETQTGATIHRIDNGEDTGEILCQQAISIPLGADLKDLRQQVMDLGTQLMICALCNIADLRGTPQPLFSPTIRARNLDCNEGLVKWDEWEVERIWHLLCGFPEVIQSNPSYKNFSISLKPANYSKEYIDMPLGSIVYAEGRYILPCKDGILFLRNKT